MHFASLWPLSACIAVLTILQFIECDAGAMYAMPSSDSVPEASGLPSSAVGAAATHQSDSLDSAGSQSSSFARNMPFLPVNHFYYTRALRNAFGKLLAVHSDEMAARDGDPAAIVDSLLTSDDDPAGDAQSVQPFTRPTNGLQLKPSSSSNASEKRAKPSLSISNSLDVLRQQVMLDFARRQMRENIKQIEMNRAHLNSIGKRAGGYRKTDAPIEAMTRQPNNNHNDNSNDIDNNSNESEFYQRLLFQHQLPHASHLQLHHQTANNRLPTHNAELFADLLE